MKQNKTTKPSSNQTKPTEPQSQLTGKPQSQPTDKLQSNQTKKALKIKPTQQTIQIKPPNNQANQTNRKVIKLANKKEPRRKHEPNRPTNKKKPNKPKGKPTKQTKKTLHPPN